MLGIPKIWEELVGWVESWEGSGRSCLSWWDGGEDLGRVGWLVGEVGRI